MIDITRVRQRFEELLAASTEPAHLKQIDDAFNGIEADRAAAERERQRTAKNPELRARCVELAEQIKSLTAQINMLGETVAPLESDRQAAQRAVSEYIEARPNGPYVSHQEFEAHTARQAELQAALDKVHAAIRTNKIQHAELMQQLLTADEEFQRVSFQERISRPRQPEEPKHSDGQLLGVL